MLDNMKILVSYRQIPESKGWATGDMMVRAFTALGHETHAYAKSYMMDEWIENPRMLLDKDFDLFLFMECGDGDRTYLELNQIRTKRKFSYFFDAALYPDKWKQIVSFFGFDANFIANKNMVDMVSNSHYLPYAADETLHYRPLDFPKTRDFAIIGSDRPERRAIIASLRDAGLDAHLITNVYREQYVDALASTRFVINDVAGGGASLIPMRPFECLAAGSVLMTPMRDGCIDLGLNCIEYDGASPKLILSLCEGALPYRDSDEYKLSITKSQDEILKNHTYMNRCERMLECLDI